MSELLTPRQRAILQHRVERAIRWKQSQAFERDNCRLLASAVMDELEFSGFTAGTQRRAVERVITSIERETA